jgi:hypothetical protein
MSLYCFGKLRLRSGQSVRSILIPHVNIGRIDPDDAAELDKELSGSGEYFSICDDAASAGATARWIEAMDRPNDLSLTPFGNAVHSLIFSPALIMGAIGFADGGIDTVLRGTTDQCWKWFAERVVLPWDNMDNPLLIWTTNYQR